LLIIAFSLRCCQSQGDCSDLKCSATTGDDPDFVRTNTPAQAYSTNEACMNNCVDPTVGCVPGNNAEVSHSSNNMLC
jgi:hypothetical protein